MTPYIWQFDNLNQALSELSPTWHGQFSTQSTQITTDTRKIERGDIFLAIKGDNFDGHEFVNVAYGKGAVLAIVNEQVQSPIPQVVIGDSKKALGLLGKYRRDVHPDLTVIALTGSSGKTTTKEMLGSILSQIAPTLITRGNLNNDLGVPMMLLELTDEHRFAVLELGANHLGEIAYTTSLVSPDVACVLNIGTAHLGEFGGRENIARAKAEIFTGLVADGVAVLPFGDEFYTLLASEAGKFTQNHISFGEQAQKPEVALDFSKLSDHEKHELAKLDSVQVMGDVFCDDVELLPTHSTFTLVANLAVDDYDECSIKLPLLGEHNVVNALSATACAIALGLDMTTIKTGLENTAPPKGRLTRIPFGTHTLIDDTYNANPTSIFLAGKVLAGEMGRKILVLGDISELGDEAVNEHTKLGQSLATLDIDHILTVGMLMKHCTDAVNAVRGNSVHFDTKPKLLAHLKTLLTEPSSVLFKGSRSATMETLIDDLKKVG